MWKLPSLLAAILKNDEENELSVSLLLTGLLLWENLFFAKSSLPLLSPPG